MLRVARRAQNMRRVMTMVKKAVRGKASACKVCDTHTVVLHLFWLLHTLSR